MRLFLTNILYALLWLILTSEFSLKNLITGFIAGFIVLWLVFRKTDKTYFSKFPSALDLILYFLKQLFISNFSIAADLITPSSKIKPAIVAFNTRVHTPFQYMLFSNLITLTPGTLVLDYSEEEQIMYIHLMYAYHEEDMLDSISRLEDKILKL